MSKFFRSPNSSDSSLSGSSSGGEDAEGEDTENVSGRQLAQLGPSTTKEVSRESDISLESLTFDRRSSASGPSWHRDFLLHALLEERCLNEVLRERGVHAERRTSHDDREIQREAQIRYQKLCAQLAPLNLVSTGLEHERHKPTRQKYRDGLDILRKGSITTAGVRDGVPAPMRRLLTDSDSVFRLGRGSDTQSFTEPTDSGSMLDAFAPSHQLLVPSQYLRDFEELGTLGKGGYGTVFHVKHRLDGLPYAVKKVPIRPSVVARIQSSDGQTALDEMLTELRTLAKLEHPNVVRYFNSWIEWSTDMSTVSYSDEPLSGDHVVETDNVLHSGASYFTTSSSLHRIVTQSDPQDDIGIAFESRSSHASDGSASQIAVGMSDVFSNSATDGALWSSSEPTLALHMQMAMYPMTLQDFISPKPIGGVTPLAHCFHLEPSIAILLAIIDGVEYLHSEGIIHRDLKPANIFLRLENNPRSGKGCVDLFLCSACRLEKRANPAKLSVRIGDFGLVTRIARPEDGDASPQPAVGTEIYRPTTGKSSISPKLDIFALGIITCELLCKFDTQMERRETLQALKRGDYRPDLLQCAGEGSSQLKECVAAMLSDDPWNAAVSFDELRKCLAAVMASTSPNAVE